MGVSLVSVPWRTAGPSLFALAACSMRNEPPGRPGIDILPTVPYTGDDLRIVIVEPAEDPEGDPVRYHVRWFENGEIRPEMNGTVVAAERTEAGGYWIAEVWATDGYLAGPVADATAYVFNSIPEVRSLQVLPAAPDTDADLIALAEPGDADGEEVELFYAWTVDGEDAGISGTIVSAEQTVRGQEWRVTVTPYDGDDWGAPRSAAVQVLDSPPTAPVVAIEPASPRAQRDPLICGIVEPAEDLDGDPLSYRIEWWVDGRLFEAAQDGALAGDTVPAEWTQAFQHWTCLCYASDGTVEGEPGTAVAQVR